MRRFSVVLFAILASLPAVAGAVDQIKLRTGTSFSGRLTKMGSLYVELEDKDGGQNKVGVNEIAQINYDGEPSAMRSLRSEVINEHYADALKMMEKSVLSLGDGTREEILQDLAYYKAFCNARLALNHDGDIQDAGKEMAAFVKANPNSYHYLEACETIGDMLAASRKFGAAADFYHKLAAAPWPDYKIRAGIAEGRALIAQQKFADAMKSFDAVLAIEGKGEAVAAGRLSAKIGRARCMGETGQTDEAIKIAKEIIDKTDAGDADTQAHAYVALGVALRKARRDKEALIAFLHVDLLYNTVPDAHAESLANLADLWAGLRQNDRATRARQTLIDRYGG